jgi:hypothetical protein
MKGYVDLEHLERSAVESGVYELQVLRPLVIQLKVGSVVKIVKILSPVASSSQSDYSSFANSFRATQLNRDNIP